MRRSQQELRTSPEHLKTRPILSEFVLRNLLFSVYCLVELSFVFFLLFIPIPNYGF